jgi:hypothetical protein
MLNEIPQLETLILHSASPITPDENLLISEHQRTVSLPSLTKFDISAPAEDCASSFAHLVLPAVTLLRVEAESCDADGNDVRLLIPCISRNAHGSQDKEPLQSMVVSADTTYVQILAWTVPDGDLEVRDMTSMFFTETHGSASVRVVFTVNCEDWWEENTNNMMLDALFRQLPLKAISTLTTRDHTRLYKRVWLHHAPRFAMLERVRPFCNQGL